MLIQDQTAQRAQLASDEDQEGAHCAFDSDEDGRSCDLCGMQVTNRALARACSKCDGMFHTRCFLQRMGDTCDCGQLYVPDTVVGGRGPPPEGTSAKDAIAVLDGEEPPGRAYMEEAVYGDDAADDDASRRLRIVPYPAPWTHNNCGPFVVMQICHMLMRCLPALRGFLSPETLQFMDNVATWRDQPAAVTPTTPWRNEDKCGCRNCRVHNRTAQDAYIERHVYEHMNRNRTAADMVYEGLPKYIIGEALDVHHMFEAVLGLRDKDASPLPGLSLNVTHRCDHCTHETRMIMGALETADSLGQPLPGNQCPSGSTQQFLDQLTGAKSILDHLDDDDADEKRDKVDHYGGTCTLCNPHYNTVLPHKLDRAEPLPPLLRINKNICSGILSQMCDTMSVEGGQDEPSATYVLLGIIYGNGAHFTADVRYHWDKRSRQWFHYDPFNFPQDRVLALEGEGEKPSCHGGRPKFAKRHGSEAKSRYIKYTGTKHVVALIYGLVPSAAAVPPNPAEPTKTAANTVSAPSGRAVPADSSAPMDTATFEEDEVAQ